MEDIIIYRHDDISILAAPVTDNCERVWNLMAENYVRLVWESEKRTILPARAYIVYNGVRYTLLEPYYPTKKSANHYSYDVKFLAVEMLFAGKVFFRHVTVDNKTWKEPEFTINANLLTIANIIVDSMNKAGSGVTFSLPANNSYADTELKSLVFDGEQIYNALTYIAEQFETEWWIENGNILRFDRCELGDIIELGDDYTENSDGIWESAGLQSVTPSSTRTNVPQRIYAYGSDRNIIRQSTDVGDMNVSYAKRLHLDETEYPGGYIEIAGVTSGIEEVKIFDDVYPRRVGIISSVRKEERKDITIWYVKDNELPSIFNPAEHRLPGTTILMKFESGYLNGFEFEVNWKPAYAEFEIINTQNDDMQLPYGTLAPNVGDKYVLSNMKMPQSYITLAQHELAVEAKKYVDELAQTVPNVMCESEPLYWQQYGVVISIGSRMRVTSEILSTGKAVESRVVSLSYKLTRPYNVNFTLSSGRVIGRLAKMENTIASQIVQIDGINQSARGISRNSWLASQELAGMLDSIQKELVLVGSEEGQFIISSGITWENAKGTLMITKGYLVHAVFNKGSQLGNWIVQQATFTPSEASKPYYVYIKCAIDSDRANVVLSSAKLAYDSETGYYHFLAGVLSAKYEGGRVYNQSSGLTQIAGGVITTQVLQDALRNLIIDFSSIPPRIIARNGAVIQGKIIFEDGKNAAEEIEEVRDSADAAQQTAEDAKNLVDNLQIGVGNLIAKRYMLDWNEEITSTCMRGSDDDGDYYEIEEDKLYTIANRSKQEDIFKGKIKFKPETQYILTVKWKNKKSETSTDTNNGLWFVFVYTDGTSDLVLCCYNTYRTITTSTATSKAGKSLSHISSTYGNNSAAQHSCIYDIQLTEGNKAPAGWIEALQDRIPAEKNLLQNSAQLQLIAPDTDNYKYKIFKPTESLRQNEDYVISIGSTIVNSYTSENPPTEISIIIFDKSVRTAYKYLYMPISRFSKSIHFFTPNGLPDECVLLIYAGRSQQTAGNDITFSKIKLARGTVATEWTAAPEDIDNAVKNATDLANGKNTVFRNTPTVPYSSGDLWVTEEGKIMTSHVTRTSGNYVADDWRLDVKYDNTQTVIDGGIVTSGTLQVAGNPGKVRAGITGKALTTNPDSTDATDNDTAVRVWAGDIFEKRETAPARILDNGDAYFSKCYSFFPAFEINSNNKDKCFTGNALNLDFIGSKIFLAKGLGTIAVNPPKNSKYVGSTIEIYNPFFYNIGFCGNVLPPSYCTIENMFFDGKLLPVNPVSGEYYSAQIRYANDSSNSFPRWAGYSYQLCINNTDKYPYLRLKCVALPAFRMMTNKITDLSTFQIAPNQGNTTTGIIYYHAIWVVEEAIKEE